MFEVSRFTFDVSRLMSYDFKISDCYKNYFIQKNIN